MKAKDLNWHWEGQRLAPIQQQASHFLKDYLEMLSQGAASSPPNIKYEVWCFIQHKELLYKEVWKPQLHNDESHVLTRFWLLHIQSIIKKTFLPLQS